MTILERIQNEIEYDVLDRFTSYVIGLNSSQMIQYLNMVEDFRQREGIEEPKRFA